MKKINLLFTLIFFLSIVSYAEEKILRCGDNKYRIKLPLVGFDKFFLERDSKWLRFKNFENTEEQFKITEVPTFQKRCAKEDCKTTIIISKELVGDRHVEYSIKASTDGCMIDGFDIEKFLIQEEGYNCYKRKKGTNLEKGYCEIIS